MWMYLSVEFLKSHHWSISRAYFSTNGNILLIFCLFFIGLVIIVISVQHFTSLFLPQEWQLH